MCQRQKAADLSVEQAQKICRYEATQAMPYVEPFSVAYHTRENLIGQCLEAKGFDQRLIGQRNIYTGTVTPYCTPATPARGECLIHRLRATRLLFASMDHLCLRCKSCIFALLGAFASSDPA